LKHKENKSPVIQSNLINKQKWMQLNTGSHKKELSYKLTNGKSTNDSYLPENEMNLFKNVDYSGLHK
jgi:hypothetical protein